jgi:hypothetical protein
MATLASHFEGHVLSPFHGQDIQERVTFDKYSPLMWTFVEIIEFPTRMTVVNYSTLNLSFFTFVT